MPPPSHGLKLAEYRDLFQGSDQGFCVFEMLLDDAGRPMDYRFLEINRTFQEQTGLVDALGKTALELVPDLEPYWIQTYGAVARTGEPIHFVQESAAMGRWFDVYAASIGAPERRLVALTFTDITAHRREQADRIRTQERLDLAVNSGDVGLWYCDLPFDKLVWNTKVKAHFGLPPDAEVTIDTFYDRIHPDDREPTRQAIDGAIARRESYDTQYRTVGLDGATRWIRAIGGAGFEHDRPVRFDGVTVDVTELVRLREAAEAASQAKDEFLAMLGHELRNPLAPILTALQLLKLRGVAAVEQERGVIERQVRHLVRLVDDLLDVSRITRGLVELRQERVTVADLVARAAEMAGPLIEQRRHDLSVDVPRSLTVDGDPGRLAQVVANLLTNAAKYTEPGGSVSVIGAADGDHIRLTVRDSGVGIDEVMLRRVFDLFVQERQSLARSDGGLGLGLAIVRSLVELHGGTVTAHSDGRGRGSAFTICLPAAAGPPEPRPDVAVSAVVPAAAPSGVRVLVVDDNVDAASMLAELLTSFGYETRVVADGPAALAEAARFHPDVALVDIGLPVMDGFEVATRLRAQATRSVTLIAVTGYGQARDRQASADAGFAAHLVKPVDMDHLREVLASVSGDARAL